MNNPSTPDCKKCGSPTHFAQGNGKKGHWRAFFCNNKACGEVIWLPHTAPPNSEFPDKPTPLQIIMDEVTALNKRVDDISAYLAQEIREGRLSQPKK